MRNLYSQDGEAEILMPAMDPRVQAAFMDILTDFCKGPPSATAIHQAWDRNKSFRDCKRGMKTVTEAGTDTTNLTLERNMNLAFRDLKIAFPEVKIAAAVEAKMMKAAEVIVFVQKSNYTNSRKHVVSYQVTCNTSLHTTLHTTPHHTVLHCTAHHTSLHITLHCTLHCTARQTSLHTTLHCTLHSTAPYSALHCTQHSTAHYTVQYTCQCTVYSTRRCTSTCTSCAPLTS
jgi:hypothetical protein